MRSRVSLLRTTIALALAGGVPAALPAQAQELHPALEAALSVCLDTDKTDGAHIEGLAKAGWIAATDTVELRERLGLSFFARVGAANKSDARHIENFRELQRHGGPMPPFLHPGQAFTAAEFKTMLKENGYFGAYFSNDDLDAVLFLGQSYVNREKRAFQIDCDLLIGPVVEPAALRPYLPQDFEHQTHDALDIFLLRADVEKPGTEIEIRASLIDLRNAAGLQAILDAVGSTTVQQTIIETDITVRPLEVTP